MWQVVRDWLLNTVFPDTCCGCSTLGSLLCPACQNTVEFVLKPPRVPEQAADLDSVTILTAFDELSHKLVVTYKYSSVIGVGAVMAHLIAEHAQLPKIDVLTAVPLHPSKESDRGFNQAAVIAQHLNTALDLPYTALLTRKRTGTRQATLKKQQRWQHNMAVFSIPPQQASACVGKHIGLVDDVFTTGATLQACAHQLKKAGAASVHGICFTHGQ
ncbi:MAG: phosphoribosyltransferase family protein [Patescibacteria group bacterium]